MVAPWPAAVSAALMVAYCLPLPTVRVEGTQRSSSASSRNGRLDRERRAGDGIRPNRLSNWMKRTANSFEERGRMRVGFFELGERGGGIDAASWTEPMVTVAVVA